jgi:hypothetical protein
MCRGEQWLAFMHHDCEKVNLPFMRAAIATHS